MRGSAPIAEGFGTPSLGEEPMMWATYLLVRFLQGLFNHMPQGAYRWEPDAKTTEITVSDQATVKSEVVAKRPAILVMRGPCQFANLGLDQLLAMNLLTGERYHTDLISGTFTLQCVSKHGPEAQHVAWLAMRGIREYKRLMQKYWVINEDDGTQSATFGFHKIGDQLSVGGETAPGSVVPGGGDHTYILVPIQVPFFLQWTWRAVPQAPSHREDLGLILEKPRASDVEAPEFDRAEEVLASLSTVPPPTHTGSGVVVRATADDVEVLQESGMSRGPTPSS